MLFAECRGSHYEMGFSQGEVERGSKVIDRALKLPTFRMLLPRIPFPLLVRLGKLYSISFERKMRKLAPNQYERIVGISDGCGRSRRLISMLNAAEIAFTLRKYDIGCTAFVISPERSPDGPFIAKNYDLLSGLNFTQIVRVCKPDDGYSSIELTEIFLSGNHNGINERGLAAAYTMVNARDIKVGVTPTILIQEILERCSTVDEAIELIRKSERGRGANILLADESGEVSVVETCPHEICVREGDVIVSTNHFVTDAMKQYDIPPDALYPRSFHPSLRGIRYHRSTGMRYERAKSMLDRDCIGIEDAVQVLRDHEVAPGDDTICRHGEVFSTLSSVILIPRRREMLVSHGNPCSNEYVSFTIR